MDIDLNIQIRAAAGDARNLYPLRDHIAKAIQAWVERDDVNDDVIATKWKLTSKQRTPKRDR